MKHLIPLFILAIYSCTTTATPPPVVEVIEPEAGIFPSFKEEWGMSRGVYNQAVVRYAQERGRAKNKRYAVIVDFSKHAATKRLFLFDLEAGTMNRHHVTAGLNSDPDGDGYATKFSNTPGSKQSSLGVYLTAETYSGSNGYSMRLDGIDVTNNKARSRAIVVHPANYVNESKNFVGRSWGCPALDPKVSKSIIDRIKGGAFFFIGR